MTRPEAGRGVPIKRELRALPVVLPPPPVFAKPLVSFLEVLPDGPCQVRAAS
jgi:hypothetical protein